MDGRAPDDSYSGLREQFHLNEEQIEERNIRVPLPQMPNASYRDFALDLSKQTGQGDANFSQERQVTVLKQLWAAYQPNFWSIAFQR